MYMTILKMTRESILKVKNPLDINNSSNIHQWITSQQDKSRATDKLLYKTIVIKDEIFLYIQSNTPFNISNINSVGLVFVKSFEIESLINRIYVFDLQVFPCTQSNDKTHFIKNINDRYSWLNKKFASNGIKLLECTEYKQNKTQVKNKFITTTSYKGKLYIDNVDLATNLICNGVGRLKNFGCGLLLLA